MGPWLSGLSLDLSSTRSDLCVISLYPIQIFIHYSMRVERLQEKLRSGESGYLDSGTGRAARPALLVPPLLAGTQPHT